MSRCNHPAHRVAVYPGRTLADLRRLVEMAAECGMPADSVIERDTNPDHGQGGLMASLPGYDPALWDGDPLSCPMSTQG